jgi:Na+-transporting NADH:ubiquinone oxidoreductase subunit A
MHFHLKDGLDIPINGVPEQSIYPGQPVRQVALSGLDYHGLKPKMLVAEGEQVRLGQPLFTDKHDPAVQFTAPGTGTVIAVNRGARRALETVVIRLADNESEQITFDSFTNDEIVSMDRDRAASQLLASGAWTAFRTRPFSRVPASGGMPRSIFVTAIDTQPLAADPRVVIREDREAFDTGLLVLSRLTEGKVFLCTGAGWDIQSPSIERLQTIGFKGPHPAGLPGTHIHYLDPVGADRMVWHIGYQDVIAFGHLFATGRFDTRRVIAIGGEPLRHPSLIRTRLGASIEDLIRGEHENPESCRVISGSVLTGRTAAGSNAYLGRYHFQVSVIRESRGRRLFGWLGSASRRYSASGSLLKRRGHRRKYSFTTAQNGRFSGMLPVRLFDKVVPLDILPSSLFRALMVRDTDQAQALGCLELGEEDLALCSFVCPAKYDYGTILRLNLDLIEKEG